MADDDEDAEDEDEDHDSGGSTKLLLVIGAAVLLVIGGVAVAYSTGLLDPVLAMLSGGEEVSELEEQDEGDAGNDDSEGISGGATYYDVPQMLLNLNTPGRKSTFLKIRISLELGDPKDVQRVEQMMPRIMDKIQVYLRGLRIDDLKGAAGIHRLRRELLTRVAAVATQAQISQVLFKEILVQ